MTRADVIAYLESLDAHALGDLIDELQRRLGLPSPQPQSITMGAPMLQGVAYPDEFTVFLLGVTDSRKVEVMRALRQLSPLGLLEVKRLIDSAPVALLTGCSRDRAEECARSLREAGARVEIRGET